MPPEDPRITNARQLVAAGRSEQAVDPLTQLLAEKPRHTEANRIMASIMETRQDHAAAEAHARVVHEADPSSNEDRLRYAMILSKQTKYDEAIPHLERLALI